MNYALPKVQEADLNGKKVLLRADLDVPLIQPPTNSHTPSAISDDLRLEYSLETINYLIQKGAKVIVVGHLGRPAFAKATSGKPPELKNRLSLEVVADWYGKKMKYQTVKSKHGQFNGWDIGESLVVLENLRLNKGEESNDPEFSQKLASLAQVYVNDAFASSHRPHASIVGIPPLLTHFAGLRLQKEIEELSKVLENPPRPLTVIIGGAKIETKLPLVSKMHHFADFVLVGGELAEHDKELIQVQHENVSGQKSVLFVADLIENKKDITVHSAENFAQIIGQSKTVVWNGPMGIVEEEEFSKGTQGVANAIINSDVHSIVGGGDTVGFLNQKKSLSKFSFVSTGGGAMLEFLAGEKLPGLTALQN